MAEKKAKKVGVVIHYYDKIGVGIVKLTNTLKTGDVIKFKGKKTDFDQEVAEMEIEHQKITEAKKGQEIGLKVKDKVREGDSVSLV